MAVNMAYVPFPESGTKVFKMTPPWNGSVENWAIQTNVSWKYSPPLSSSPRGFFAKIARDLQIILKHAPATLILNVLWVVYIFRKGVHLSIFYWDYSGMKLY